MKKIKIKCPYFILLVLTSILFGCLSMVREGGYMSEFLDRHSASDAESEGKDNGDKSAENAEGEIGKQQEEAEADSVSGNSAFEDGSLGNTISGNTVSGNSFWNAENFESMYLSDTLFIGDSRTTTLHEYGGWDEATFYAKNGLNIWDVLDEKIADYNGKKITVDEALQKEHFGRIYIMLGINELGRGTPETFAEQYGMVVERIRELQPDALIIVQAIMHVTQEKDAEQTYINNAEINARNEKIKEMAEQKEVYWLDVNPVTDDAETGCLVSTYSFDGVHLKVKYLDVWKQFILENPF